MELLIIILLLLLAFAALLMITCIVNFLVSEWTVYNDIGDMIKARKGVSCIVTHEGFYGDWLCCGHCKSLLNSDWGVCPTCHYRIIRPKELKEQS